MFALNEDQIAIREMAESFAAERGLAEISVDTLYEAKAHYAR